MKDDVKVVTADGTMIGTTGKTLMLASKIATVEAMTKALNTAINTPGEILIVGDVELIAKTAKTLEIPEESLSRIHSISTEVYEREVVRKYDNNRRNLEMLHELRYAPFNTNPTNWGRCYAKDFKTTTSYASQRRAAKKRRKAKC